MQHIELPRLQTLPAASLHTASLVIFFWPLAAEPGHKPQPHPLLPRALRLQAVPAAHPVRGCRVAREEERAGSVLLQKLGREGVWVHKPTLHCWYSAAAVFWWASVLSESTDPSAGPCWELCPTRVLLLMNCTSSSYTSARISKTGIGLRHMSGLV